MATPTFNTAQAGGLPELKFENGGMSAKLSASGNTIRVLVETLKMGRLEYSPVGADWTISRTMGKQKRRVAWEVQLKAASDADLNDVEYQIEQHLNDGGAYVLTDGKGRSNNYAVLAPDATQRIGYRVPLPSGGRLQRWRLVFDVLRRSLGATKL